jgi:uncharacterized membrane protein YuzA (DUF378 family)
MGIEDIVYVISTLLVIVGALNWGAYALGHNLVEKLGNKNVKNAIYYLIAISGIVSLIFLIRNKGRKNYDSSAKTFNVGPTSKPARMGGIEQDWKREEERLEQAWKEREREREREQAKLDEERLEKLLKQEGNL